MQIKEARQAGDRLRKGGLPEEQANAIVDLIVGADTRVVTKEDVDGLEERVMTKLDSWKIGPSVEPGHRRRAWSGGWSPVLWR